MDRYFHKTKTHNYFGLLCGFYINPSHFNSSRSRFQSLAISATCTNYDVLLFIGQHFPMRFKIITEHSDDLNYRESKSFTPFAFSTLFPLSLSVPVSVPSLAPFQSLSSVSYRRRFHFCCKQFYPFFSSTQTQSQTQIPINQTD